MRTRLLLLSAAGLSIMFAGCLEQSTQDAVSLSAKEAAIAPARSSMEQTILRTYSGTVREGACVPSGVDECDWHEPFVGEKPGHEFIRVTLPGRLLRANATATWTAHAASVDEGRVELSCFKEEGGWCGEPEPIFRAQSPTSPVRAKVEHVPILPDDGLLFIGFSTVKRSEVPVALQYHSEVRFEIRATFVVEA